MADEHDAEAVRRERLDQELRGVAADRERWTGERIVVVLAGGLVGFGLLLVLIGWRGASRTPNVHEQIPYLISGAELGQTIALIGALLYFSRWLVAMLREHRAQGRAVIAALERIEQALTTGAPVVGGALVATARGSLAHRPDCALVAGRAGLRSVPESAGMARCKVCLPETR